MNKSIASTFTSPASAYKDWVVILVPGLLGGVLVAGGVAKAFAPSSALLILQESGLPSWLLVPAVAAEVGLGTILLLIRPSRRLLDIAICTFAVFAALSLNMGFAGARSCGCFGSLRINPWWMFAIDICAVASLLIVRHSILEARIHVGLQMPRIGVAITVLCVAGGTLSVLWGNTSATAEFPGTVGDRNIVLLQPESWRGLMCPLLDQIESEADLSKDSWTVILYHHSCDACKRALPLYERLAIERARHGQRVGLVLVEMPPHAKEVGRFSQVLHGRLSDDKEWFVQTPLELQLQNGVVTQASYDLPSISNSASAN